jgi:hypothetical protein
VPGGTTSLVTFWLSRHTPTDPPRSVTRKPSGTTSNLADFSRDVALVQDDAALVAAAES